MRRILLLIALGVGAVVSPALAADALLQTARKHFRPVPAAPPQLSANPATPDKVELGKMLFFEPRLSESWMLSCNACHNLATGGVDLQETSIGHGWRKGPRNAPTVLNAVFNIAQFWDGRAEDLEDQATGPMMNPGEMGSSAERVLGTLRSIPEYGERFKRAFPGEADPVHVGNVAKAIAAFEATALLTPNAPFDRYLAGDTGALSERQREGLRLFVEKGCVGCHDGTNVGGGRYARFGAVQAPGGGLLPATDKGRSTVTGRPEDEYVFRVAPLRNVALTPPYFHSGEVWDLEDAVAIMGRAQLGQELAGEEVEAITEFLQSLTGEQPQIVYPVLPVVAGDPPLPRPFDNP